MLNKATTYDVASILFHLLNAPIPTNLSGRPPLTVFKERSNAYKRLLNYIDPIHYKAEINRRISV